MIEGMIKKVTDEMKREVDLRLDGFEAKIDAIGDDIVEIKSMLQKSQ